MNCFTCHSNVSSTKPTSFAGNGAANFSHLFKEAVQTGGCAGGLPAGCSAEAAAVKRGAALLGFPAPAPVAVSSHAPGANPRNR